MTDLVPVRSPTLRGRGHVLTVLGLWALELAMASLLAWPLVAFVGRTYRYHPAGDAPLFRRASIELLQLVVQDDGARASLFAGLLALLLLAFPVFVLGCGTTLVRLSFATSDRRPPGLSACVARAARVWPRLAAAQTLTLGLQLSLMGLSFGLARLATLHRPAHEDVRGDVIAVIVVALGFTFATALGMAHDLARAAIVRFDMQARLAVRLAWRSMRRRVWAMSLGWAWRTAAGVIFVMIGGLVAEGAAGRAGWILLGLFAFHQTMAIARAALKVSWYALTLRLIDASGLSRG